MREILMVIGIFIALAVAAFLWWGGLGLLLLGSFLVLVCISGMGLFAGPPPDVSLAHAVVDETRSRQTNISKSKIFMWVLPVAFAILLIGFFFADVPAPAGGLDPVVL